MKRFVLSFALLFLFAPVVAQAACCKCLRPGVSLNTCLTDPTATCTDILAKNGSNKDLSGFVCQSISEAECKPVAAGGSALCQNGPTVAAIYTAPPATAPTKELVTVITAPTLNVPIPGLRFSTNIPIYSDAPTAEIPFLSQYLVAIFNYFFGIVIITAAVMIVYGGFKYILSSTMGGIKDGKDVIKDAIIGLLLAFGTYTILQTLNPALTSFKPIGLTFIIKEGFKFGQAQMTTQVDTISGTAGAGGPTSGSYTPPLTDCPFVLSNPLILADNMSSPENQKILKADKVLSLNIVQDRRAQEFFKKISELTTGKTFEDKVKITAEAAVKCGIHMQSCGNTAGTIWELAGVGDKACLTDQKVSCNPHENYFLRKNKPSLSTATIVQIPGNSQMATFNSLRCVNECGAKYQNLPGCIDDKSKSVAAVRDALGKMDNWPDQWLNDLKPGDIIQVYTGNTSCGGGHSALFVGWAGNSAQVIQGEFGKKVTAGTLCVKKGCGANMLPLLRVIKPVTAK